MAWIELHQNIRDNKKTMRLSKLLKINKVQTVGHLVFLWLWSLDNCQDGDLSKLTEDEISDAAGWDGESRLFIDSLKTAGWIDKETMEIHDWFEYAGKLIAQREIQREQTNERVKRYRDKVKKGKLIECNAVVTHYNSVCNADVTHPPYPTVPNHIERDIAREETENQVDVDNAIKTINDKSFEFSMNGISPEFQEDAKTRLKEGTEPELIIKALSIGATKASGSGPSKCRYAISVLQGWASEGIKTVTQWTEKNAPKPNARDRPQNKVPQKGNFDQRKYPDEHFDNLFKEV
jgi:DnaD/phage-associated family protein